MAPTSQNTNIWIEKIEKYSIYWTPRRIYLVNIVNYNDFAVQQRNKKINFK